MSDDPSEGSWSPMDSTPPSPISMPKEPLAICGLGDSTSPHAFWDLLSNGKSGKCNVPKSRFNVDGFYHPNGSERPGSMMTKGGYFLNEDTREFENSMFGINNLEATYMDPQQRKLLEVVFECLENAGVPLNAASGSNTGCYVGNFTFDYLVMQSRDADYLTRYNSTGMGTSILGNRISHVFNLKGPSLVIDTACSSSLYCLHVACTALENHECDAAIVAGANLIQSAEQHIGTMKAGVLSATSECHTFDASADGYGRAEGIGALYVKRLSDAIRDGDAIRSVIKGSAINANGKTAGISLPSADGQEAVIRKAMSKASLSPEDITYIECHGTGTKVGDAIEVEGLSRVFHRPADRPLFIGSVKSNIGHSEAASGIAGVIKSTLSLEKGHIPPTYGLKKLNPKLEPFKDGISIPTELIAWPGDKDRIPRIGINSFGYGGANAHVILEKGTPLGLPPTKRPFVPQSSLVFPLSAATMTSLEARVEDLARHDFGNTNILDLAYTLGSRRTNFQTRGFLIAKQAMGLNEVFTTQSMTKGIATSQGVPPPLAFVFTGQGSQWPGMCKELFEFPVFRNVITEMDSTLKGIPHAPTWSLREAILDIGNPDLIHTPQRSQPCCTAIQIALVQLLASWNILPDTTVGHSSGEIAAAFAAGHITAAEAIVIAYYRGLCVSKSVREGAMMAAGLSEAAANDKIAQSGLQKQAIVACINSPEGVTISGDCEAIDKLLATLQSDGSFARKLKTGGQAYHSHHMLPLGNEYQSLLDRVLPTLGPSRQMNKGARVISSVTAEPKSSDFNSSYWRSNLESQVRFAQAIHAIHSQAHHAFVELGPHSSLELPVKQTLAQDGVSGSQVQYFAPVKRNTDALASALGLPGNLWINGFAIDWTKVNGLCGPGKSVTSSFSVVTDLPRYRFKYDEVLWNEGRASLEYRQRKHPRHELLGSLIPGGNGDDLVFRNILRVDDIAWLKDHKLEDTIVFPGAGYICTAMEAVMQATDIPLSAKPSFRFSNVNILNALVLSEDAAAKTEMFTSLHKSAITNAATSSLWWDFSVSTYQNGSSIPHAKGSISIAAGEIPMQPKYEAPNSCLEPTAKRTWYDRLLRTGLNYGPAFQPISEFSTPSMKAVSFSGAKAQLLTTYGDELAVYPVHPATLDAMLQTAIVATAEGLPANLHAKVPTRFGSIVLNTAAEGSCQINAHAQITGFGSAETGSEIVTSAGDVAVQFNEVRLTPYTTGTQVDTAGERHPMLRSLWKPDVYGLGLMDVRDTQLHMDNFVAEASSPLEDDSIIRLGAMLDLTVHKNPRVRILELGNDIHDITLATLDLLASKSEFKRLSTYTTASFGDDGSLNGGLVDLETGERSEPGILEGQDYQVILIPIVGPWLAHHMDKIRDLLAEDGTVLALCPGSTSETIASSALASVAYPIHEGASSVVVARNPPAQSNASALQSHRFLIVDRDHYSKLGSALEATLKDYQSAQVHHVLLSELGEKDISAGDIVFNLAELTKPLLSTITDEDMQRVKLMTENAHSIVWVTNGNITEGGHPDFALVSGLSRALVLEQPSLKFYTYDLDTSEPDVAMVTHRLLSLLNQESRHPDFEFAQRRNVVHVSRFTPDDGLNAAFRSKQGLQTTQLALKDAGNVRLDIKNVGQFDTLYYKQQEASSSIPPGHVRLQVASAGLNAKDFYLLAGKVDVLNATSSNEYTGTVVDVGAEVTGFSQGDRVVVMAPSHFQTHQTVPQWACQKLEENDDLDMCATLPVVYSTAIYALEYRARLQKGETVLIHCGAGGVGMAAIRVAQQAGAEVFTTVSTEEKKAYLVATFGLEPSHIFSSRDTSFLKGILDATNNRGVDVVLNSLTGDQLHATWRCTAECGRFVEIGKMDLTTAGRLEMDQFLKNTTFTAFDLAHLYNSESEALHNVWNELLRRTMVLYREGKVAGFDTLKVFDIEEATQAFRFFSSRNRMGKVAINMQNGNSKLLVQRLKHETQFDSNKSYIMVGCLGGLGRTLTRWMLQRGARKFAFLGRSGLDKPAARSLARDVEAAGGECVVVRGDVCREEDVKAVVEATTGEIGGVVQAAMGLNEALFTSMPTAYWHTGIDPKVQGTWHLHRSLRASGRDNQLDFFLMTSSVSGSVGTATESNYCAGNHFLDLFARYRRAQGLPAISVGLGMISGAGYLHENPEIEALLLRKGIQAIDQDELLQILDISLSSNTLDGIHHPYDAGADRHILTGLEPMGLKELRKKGFEGTNPTLDDPRANLLASALDGQEDVLRHAHDGDLPAPIAEALEAGQSLPDALLDFIRRRFGNLTLLKYESVDVNCPFASYGMDSMIAAEFRTWFYQSLSVDVPFLTLLDKTTTLKTLRDLVLAQMEKSD
ncbi:reducing type I polyketide synthase 10 [Corynespora cassiicola Philippines]|uniref:Reducing type I polyketide synthase 10 n=1 Tax=Corynespora cassiicola Philippines TaxID=1448308 RepID=A0A2T2N555_CORCC|nr:reducing type I polyketide synthase 10 [Corynespora cassiicola Philippines]